MCVPLYNYLLIIYHIILSSFFSHIIVFPIQLTAIIRSRNLSGTRSLSRNEEKMYTSRIRTGLLKWMSRKPSGHITKELNKLIYMLSCWYKCQSIDYEFVNNNNGFEDPLASWRRQRATEDVWLEKNDRTIACSVMAISLTSETGFDRC